MINHHGLNGVEEAVTVMTIKSEKIVPIFLPGWRSNFNMTALFTKPQSREN